MIRGDTYHFEVVSNESARGVMDVALECGLPVANGILTTDTEAQALARKDKGAEAVRVALEMARLRLELADKMALKDRPVLGAAPRARDRAAGALRLEARRRRRARAGADARGLGTLRPGIRRRS